MFQKYNNISACILIAAINPIVFATLYGGKKIMHKKEMIILGHLKIGKSFFEDLLSLILNVSVLTFILTSGGSSLKSRMSLCASAGTILLDACFESVVRPTSNKRGCSKSCDIAIKMTCVWLLLLMGLSILELAAFVTPEVKLHVSVINDKCGFF